MSSKPNEVLFSSTENILYQYYPLLKTQGEWTDFHFNGSDYYLHSPQGRQKLSITSADVEGFIRQVANVMGKNFNLTYPILDVSFGRFRLMAVYSSIGRSNHHQSYSFSIRQMASVIKVNHHDVNYAPPEVFDWIKIQLVKRRSLLISGRTGTGKTELQKYLLALLAEHTRIILIEDTHETHLQELASQLDVTTWIVPPNETDLLQAYRKLLSAALRGAPDWIVIAELRGHEGLAVIEAALAGHPFISTLHAQNPEYVLPRLFHFMKSAANHDDLWQSHLATLFPFCIHMQDEIGPQGQRHYAIESIAQFHFDAVQGTIVTELIYKKNSGWSHLEKGE